MPSRWTSRVILRSLSCCPQGCWAGVAAHPQLHCPLITFTFTFPSILFISSSCTSLPGKRGGGAFWGLETSTGALGRCPHRGPPAAVRGQRLWPPRRGGGGRSSAGPGAPCPVLGAPSASPHSTQRLFPAPRGSPGVPPAAGSSAAGASSAPHPAFKNSEGKFLPSANS